MISLEWTGLIFGLNAASFILFALILMQLRIVNSDDAPLSGAGGFGFGSWGAVFHSLPPIDRWLFVYFIFLSGIVRPLFELLPSFANRFASNALTETLAYSFLTSTQGFGAMLGALMTSILLAKIPRREVAVATGLAATLAVFAFLFSSFVIAIIALAILSGAILTNGISTQIMLQTHLPREVRGRALALYTMTLRGAPALGALLFGVFAEVVTQEVLFSTASLVLLIFGLWLLLAVRRLN